MESVWVSTLERVLGSLSFLSARLELGLRGEPKAELWDLDPAVHPPGL